MRGTLTDHHDHWTDTLRLSRDNFVGHGVAATAASAREFGHAIRDASRHAPLWLRSTMVPLANAGARFGLPPALSGSLFGSPMMTMVGVLGYVGSTVVRLLTLPVEFNASRRALGELDRLGLVSEDGHEGALQVLRAAALTYVAGVASAAADIIDPLSIGGLALLGRREPPIPKAI